MRNPDKATKDAIILSLKILEPYKVDSVVTSQERRLHAITLFNKLLFAFAETRKAQPEGCK